MQSKVRLAVCVGAALLKLCAATTLDQILEQASRLDAENKCGEAESLYQKALSLSPSSPAVLNNVGNHYVVCSSPAKAQQVFERLLQRKPGHVNASLQLARLSIDRNDGIKAVHYLAGINPNDLNDPEVSLVRAEALAVSGDRRGAASLIRRIAKSSHDPRVIYTLGMMSAHRGFYSEAEDAFASVLSQVPDDFEVLFNHGLAAAHCSHFENARASFESALKLKPADTDALYELGRVETSLGAYDHAVYILAQASKTAATRADIQLALARATQMGGFYGDSVLAYDRYLAARPDDDLVRRDRALVQGYTRSGESTALDYLRSYTLKHPNDAVGFYDLAQIAHRANENNALVQVSKALQLDPKLEPALLFRSWLLNKAGRYEESVRDARTAARLNPKDARALDLVGLDNLELNRPQDAEKPIRDALALSPGEADFQFHLGRSLLEQGRNEEARPILAEFQKTRQKWTPAPREDAGIVETATLSPEAMTHRIVNDYQEAVRANPNEPALRLNLSRTLLAAGETEDALGSFRQLLGMDPPAAVSLDAGTALMRAEQYGLACDFLRRAAAETPGVNLDLAGALYFKGEVPLALEALDRQPSEARRGDFEWWRAIILGASGRKSESIAILQTEQNRPMSNARLAPEAATLLLAFGRADRALELIEKVRLSFPDDGAVALTRAVVLAQLHRLEEAIRAVRDAESRWTQWDRPYAAEALLLERAGHPDEAKARFELAAALGPNDPVVECLNGHFKNIPAGAACSCLTGIWAILTGSCH
jgi:Flp pilus assembly protein TadD